MSRPEDVLPPDLYYNQTAARQYKTSSRIKHIQTHMTKRALELLDLRTPSHVLDVGCGTCLSGTILSSIPPEKGGPHTWVGMDISAAMLGAALERGTDVDSQKKKERKRRRAASANGKIKPHLVNLGLSMMDEDGDEEDEDADEEDDNDSEGDDDEMDQDSENDEEDDDDDDGESYPSDDEVDLDTEIEGDLLLADAGQGVPFRPGSFDAAISISAIQWLCNAESTIETAEGRLRRFFDTLYSALRRGGRAVCQFYPRNDDQKKMIASAAIKAGFGAGLLEDGIGTKQLKVYLVLTVGGGDLDVAGGPGTGRSTDITGVIRGMDGVDVVDPRSGAARRRQGKVKKGSRAWIMEQKERRERKGQVVKRSSKYTGRKRHIAF